MKYKDLEIWKRSRDLVIEIHRMTLHDIPKFEFYETGSQIRRSIKSVRSNIVEGYGRRRYKSDFIHFLIMAEASLDETIDHLEVLLETGSLKKNDKNERILADLIELGKMINTFIRSVEKYHNI